MLYLTILSVFSFRPCNLHACSQESLILNIPTVRTKLGKTAFQVYAPQKWNDLQRDLEQDHLISLDNFKCLLFNVLQSECYCELQFYCVCLFLWNLIRASLEKRACSQLSFLFRSF